MTVRIEYYTQIIKIYRIKNLISIIITKMASNYIIITALS